ncbi:helix-turn-helix transcriptional regulator [Acidithiobacillus acidisediminis]|jgi:transcriptional regulator with XRE-family HTH domain|uniref:helix-turn-helix transcriptional regulator n=1 Tax=Acidithiobacillus acidisediminis TaxID=2937799 RepID=UPI00200F5C6F|nr:helix-turn-helix domain-containing protein [Acidithiobacillus sp. S30A2]MDD3761443.1 helix-turn-helix domain-containing protein [Acidithiobacillus sp.]
MTDRKLPIGNALELGRALRAERRMRGWSQEELARKIGRDRKSIVALEKGDNVGIHVLMAVLMALGKGLEIRAYGRVEYERLQEIFGDEDGEG